MPLVIYGAAHTGKQISVIFQKKQKPAHDQTLFHEIFLNKFLPDNETKKNNHRV
jgi:hypothetical protein